jgi:hypothetical protein
MKNINNIERDFLILCGFDMSNGFWSDDVERYKNLYPWLWENFNKLCNVPFTNDYFKNGTLLNRNGTRSIFDDVDE